ncbi:MAG: hypothetical protein IJ252_02200, partial [Solobacterium sp.]|nr:hypothetical protein [Solobacterium sp.]
YYLSEGDNESELDLISKGFQECRTGRTDLYEWQLGWYAQRNMRKQMLQLYRKAVKNNDSAQAVTELMYRFSADYEEKKKYLLDMIRLCYPNDVKCWYLECRDLLSADDFRNAHKELMAILKKADPEEYVNQCFEEENYAEALRTLQSRPRGRFGFEIDRDCSLLRRLAETHPEEAAELWFEKCRDLCLVSNQEKYREAAGMLRNIKSLMISFHLEDEWKTEFAQFMEENKKKRSLLKIIAQYPDLNEWLYSLSGHDPDIKLKPKPTALPATIQMKKGVFLWPGIFTSTASCSTGTESAHIPMSVILKRSKISKN